MKRQARDWENIFANQISDKGLGSRICKELSKFNSYKNAIRKWAKDRKRHFTEANIHEVLLYILATKKMQMKNLGEISLYTYQNGLNKKVTTLTTGKDIEKWDHSYIAGEKIKWYDSFRKQFGRFYKIKYSITTWSSNHLLENLCQRNKSIVKQKPVHGCLYQLYS